MNKYFLVLHLLMQLSAFAFDPTRQAADIGTSVLENPGSLVPSVGPVCTDKIREIECSKKFDLIEDPKERSITRHMLSCLKKRNILDCPLIRNWAERFEKKAKKGTSPSVIKNAISLVRRFFQTKPGVKKCFPNYQVIHDNSCFLDSNLYSIQVKKFAREALGSTWLNRSSEQMEYLILSPSRESDLELFLNTELIGRGAPGIIYMQVQKKGEKPFENSVDKGTYRIREARVELVKAELESTNYDYYGRKINQLDFSYGKNIQVPLATVADLNNSCGAYENIGANFTSALRKMENSWNPDEAEELAATAFNAAVLEGLDIGVYNLQDAGINFIEGLNGLWGLITNKEMPESPGLRKCKFKENHGKQCTGMREILIRELGSQGQKLIDECVAKSCNSNTSKTRCIVMNAGNPIFQAEILTCAGTKLGTYLGKSAYDHLMKCFGSKGANEASRCFANVAVLAATTATGAGIIRGVSGLGTAATSGIHSLVQAGRLSGTSAKWLIRLGKVGQGATTFAADMVFNALPTDLSDLAKLKVNLQGLLRATGMPADMAKVINAKIKNIDNLLRASPSRQITDSINRNRNFIRNNFDLNKPGAPLGDFTRGAELEIAKFNKSLPDVDRIKILREALAEMRDLEADKIPDELIENAMNAHRVGQANPGALSAEEGRAKVEATQALSRQERRALIRMGLLGEEATSFGPRTARMLENGTTLPYSNRREALRAAIRDAGGKYGKMNEIPPLFVHEDRLKQAARAGTASRRANSNVGYSVLDSVRRADGSAVKSREYWFLNSEGQVIVIQDHSLGHPGLGSDEMLQHFNVRHIPDDAIDVEAIKKALRANEPINPSEVILDPAKVESAVRTGAPPNLPGMRPDGHYDYGTVDFRKDNPHGIRAPHYKESSLPSSN